MSPTPGVDDAVLDDVPALEALDTSELLRAVATAGPQVREALLYVEDEALAPLAADGRPRAVVVTGTATSGLVGDVAMALAGRASPVPVLAHRGLRLPGWVGPMDVVVAVAGSGRTPETLAVLDEAVRRGCRIVTVGPAGSLLASRAEDAHGLHLAVDARGRSPRAGFWGLLVPVLLALDVLGLVHAPRAVLSSVADELDVLSQRCGPGADSAVNPAKLVALQLVDSLPYVWGSSELATVAAERFVAQLGLSAKHPAVHGALTDVVHDQLAVMAGRLGAHAGGSDDIFRDRVEDDGGGALRMRVLILRDTDETPEVAALREATKRVAERFDVPAEEIVAVGEHPVSRLASLVAPLDFASVYLGLLQGSDPTVIEPMVALEAQLAGDDR